MDASGIWMSILDYAQFKKISISSIRRYIKDERVKFKKENGKFFIYVSKEKLDRSQHSPDMEEREALQLKLENQRLKVQMRSLKEEIDELQMLVNLYELKSPPVSISKVELPELPLDL